MIVQNAIYLFEPTFINLKSLLRSKIIFIHKKMNNLEMNIFYKDDC